MSRGQSRCLRSVPAQNARRRRLHTAIQGLQAMYTIQSVRPPKYAHSNVTDNTARLLVSLGNTLTTHLRVAALWRTCDTWRRRAARRPSAVLDGHAVPASSTHPAAVRLHRRGVQRVPRARVLELRPCTSASRHQPGSSVTRGGMDRHVEGGHRAGNRRGVAGRAASGAGGGAASRAACPLESQSHRHAREPRAQEARPSAAAACGGCGVRARLDALSR